MKVRTLLALVVVALTSSVHAAGKGEAAHDQAAKDHKTIYLVFHRDWDATAQAMAAAVKATVEKHAAVAAWTLVAITDAAEKALVDKYQVSRAPMPLTLVVHPNGAVTGVYQKPAAEADLVQCLVSPKKAECMKALQENKLVLLCIQPTAQVVIPPGVQEFQADPHFAQRTQVYAVHLADPAEATFFSHLQVDPKVPALQTVFIAPPGVLVGKFPPTASKDELAKALGAAGKCCDDKNCKHNQPK